MSTPTHTDEGLTLGPVQMLVVGFDDPHFTGEIREELARLKDNDIARLIDLLLVKKNEDGEIEVLQASDLDQDEAVVLEREDGARAGAGAADQIDVLRALTRGGLPVAPPEAVACPLPSCADRHSPPR